METDVNEVCLVQATALVAMVEPFGIPASVPAVEYGFGGLKGIVHNLHHYVQAAVSLAQPDEISKGGLSRAFPFAQFRSLAIIAIGAVALSISMQHDFLGGLGLISRAGEVYHPRNGPVIRYR